MKVLSVTIMVKVLNAIYHSSKKTSIPYIRTSKILFKNGFFPRASEIVHFSCDMSG